MNISLLDVLGPVMIGPSSSHTAGAAKFAKVSAMIANKKFNNVEFGLGGSFASTYEGHFTDYALLAGVMGFNEDDERLCDSYQIADEIGLEYKFYPVDIESEYDNTARITFNYEDDRSFFVEGASLGGGRIRITNIDGLACEMSANSPTIIIKQRDAKGVLGDITNILASNNINIAEMSLNRTVRSDVAFCVIECDDFIKESITEQLKTVDNILSVVVVNL